MEKERGGRGGGGRAAFMPPPSWSIPLGAGAPHNNRRIRDPGSGIQRSLARLRSRRGTDTDSGSVGKHLFTDSSAPSRREHNTFQTRAVRIRTSQSHQTLLNPRLQLAANRSRSYRKLPVVSQLISVRTHDRIRAYWKRGGSAPPANLIITYWSV